MLIGFNGGMGSGKSTAIKVLADHTDIPVTNVKFAAPLYEMQEMIYDRVKSVYQRPADFIKDRKLLQWLGTDWGRGTLGESIWTNLWRAEAERLTEISKFSEPLIIVCDDVRFDNEAEVVRALGGIIIKIEAERASSRTVSGIANHASEAGIKPELVDIVLQNNGTLEEFKSKILQIYWEQLVPAFSESGISPARRMN